MEWMQKNVRIDLRHHAVIIVMMKGKVYNVVQVGDGGTDEKTGGGDGDGRVEYVTIFIRSNTNGQYRE